MKIVIFLSVLAFLGAQASSPYKNAPEWVQMLLKGAQKNPGALERFYQSIGNAEAGRQLTRSILSPTEVDVCGSCKTAVPPLKEVAKVMPWFIVKPLMVTLCKQLLTAVAPSTNVDVLCPGIIHMQGPHVYNIVKDSRVNADNFCRNLNLCFIRNKKTSNMADYMARHQVQNPLRPSYNSLPDVKTPEDTEETFNTMAEFMANHQVQNPLPHRYNALPQMESRKVADDVLTLVHLADIHVEPDYAIGSPTDCGLPVCCHDHDQGEGNANKWGSYRCNIPQRTMEYFISKIGSMDPKPDLVLYTGDNPPNAPWKESLMKQINCTRMVNEMLHREVSGVPVFPAMGNHEPHPTNLYFPANDYSKYLTKELVRLWEPLFPMTDAQRDTIKYAGYYTAPSGIPGLNIIAINTNFWYVMNFYNTLNEVMPERAAMQKAVLEALQKTREKGEKAIVMLHHPPGDSDFIHTSSQWYSDVVIEYSDVIALQVAGHTHVDEFKLFKDEEGKAKSLLYIAPSVTGMWDMGGVNPGMRIFTLNRKTFEVLDFEQWQMDLKDVTSDPPPIRRTYSARKDLGLDDMSAASWQQLTNRMEEDMELFKKWFLTVRQTDAPGVECENDECRADALCKLREASFEDAFDCMRNIVPQKKSLDINAVAATGQTTDATTTAKTPDATTGATTPAPTTTAKTPAATTSAKTPAATTSAKTPVATTATGKATGSTSVATKTSSMASTHTPEVPTTMEFSTTTAAAGHTLSNSLLCGLLSLMAVVCVLHH